MSDNLRASSADRCKLGIEANGTRDTATSIFRTTESGNADKAALLPWNRSTSSAMPCSSISECVSVALYNQYESFTSKLPRPLLRTLISPASPASCGCSPSSAEINSGDPANPAIIKLVRISACSSDTQLHPHTSLNDGTLATLFSNHYSTISAATQLISGYGRFSSQNRKALLIRVADTVEYLQLALLLDHGTNALQRNSRVITPKNLRPIF